MRVRVRARVYATECWLIQARMSDEQHTKILALSARQTELKNAAGLGAVYS